MFVLALSLLLFAACLYLFLSWLYRRKKCTVKVEASVSGTTYLKPGRLQPEIRHYYAVYSYKYMDKVYSVQSPEPSRTNQWKTGAHVTLFINPEKPDMFRVEKDGSDLTWAIVSGFLGLITFIVFLVW